MTVTLRAVVPILVVPALVSCASYDPALVERIEEVWDQSSAETLYENGDPQPWQEGQWVRMRTLDNGTRGLLTVALAGEEGPTHWIEFHKVEPHFEMRAALLVESYRAGDTERTRILRVKLQRPDGEIVDLEVDSEEAAEMQALRADIDILLDLLEMRHSPGRIEDVVVPAGTFQDAVEKPFVITSAEGKWKGSVWFTDAVPLTGWARVEARTPHLGLLQWKRSLQVDAFGESGARSAFFSE